MVEYRLKAGKLGKTLINAYKKIEDKFVKAFLEEDGSLKTGGMAQKATASYRKIENAVVGSYKKIEDAFVEAFLEKVEDSPCGDEHLGSASGKELENPAEKNL